MISIDKAATEDVPVIQDIARITWYPTFEDILSKEQISYMLRMMYSTESLTEQIEVKKHQFYLAKEKNMTLGFISVELNYQNQPVAKIHKIYILPMAQGRGLGKILMQKAEQLALENHQKLITLNVNRFNVALNFYSNLGYQNIKSEDINIGNGYLMEDFVLEKKLYNEDFWI